MKKQFLSLILVLCMIFTMMPSMASSDPPDALNLDLAAGSITIVDGTNNDTLKVTYGASSQVDNIDPSTIIIITQTTLDTPTSNAIVISADVTNGVKIKLDGVYIKPTGKAPLTITNGAGKVNLILADGSVNKLEATGSNAGLRKNNTGLLTISCEDAGDDHTCNSNCGKLIAEGGSESAGIGSGRAEGTASNITISGGNIEATGGASGAGIGGSDGSTGSYIIILGGNIKATGGASGAGIGPAGCGSGTGSNKSCRLHHYRLGMERSLDSRR